MNEKASLELLVYLSLGVKYIRVWMIKGLKNFFL